MKIFFSPASPFVRKCMVVAHELGIADRIEKLPSAGGARGLCRGSLYARDGRLVASAAQEGMLRIRKPAARA